MNRRDSLQQCIQDGRFDSAIEMIDCGDDFLEAEHFVHIVLNEVASPLELQEAVLACFMKSNPGYGQLSNTGGGHGSWVHSASHITRDLLWPRRMDAWIKKINEASFLGANTLGDTRCCDRLVHDFARFAKYDDDPAEFHLILENLGWMNWRWQYAFHRIEAGCFESEEAFLRWKLRIFEKQISQESVYNHLVDFDDLTQIIERFQELGIDIRHVDSVRKGLYIKRLSELEGRLATAKMDWLRRHLAQAIEMTREAFDELYKGQ